MILLDTDVVASLMTPSPSAAFVGWLNRQDAASLYLSTITLAEIGYGLRGLPDEARRRSLEDRFERFVGEAFQERVVDFDVEAARQYSEVMGRRLGIGKPLAPVRGKVAAIARAHRFALATRDIAAFEACGLDLVDPFQ